MNIDILSILQSKTHNTHFLNRYYKFILACAEKNDNADKNIYKENHHICPKAKDMFTEYSSFKIFPENKVKLTAKQHFIAHHLLWKAYDWSSMAYVFKCFVNGYKGKNSKRVDIKITASMYAKLKEDARKSSSVNRKGIASYFDENENIVRCSVNDPRVISGELRQKSKWIRNVLTHEKVRIFKDSPIPDGWLSGTGTTWNKGIPKSQEEKDRISTNTTGEKNHFFGKEHNKESKAKISVARTGYKMPEDDKKKLSEIRKAEYASGKRKPHGKRGWKHSEKSKTTQSTKAKLRPRVICEHCGLSMTNALYVKWHSEGKCKSLKPQEPTRIKRAITHISENEIIDLIKLCYTKSDLLQNNNVYKQLLRKREEFGNAYSLYSALPNKNSVKVLAAHTESEIV